MNPTTIAEQLLFSTVRIETNMSTGTAFIVNCQFPSSDVFFLVTNKHVIEDAQTGSFFFTENNNGQPAIGSKLEVRFTEFASVWTGHPDSDVDVSVLPIGPVMEQMQQQGQIPYFRSIPTSIFPSEEQLKSLDALEDVVFIGYPNGLYDKTNLLPILRQGTTATHPNIDYENTPTFLVDASVFPGSSGSPVLIHNHGPYVESDSLKVGSRAIFLGVLSAVYTREDDASIRVAAESAPRIITTQMIDLGIVFKARSVIEAMSRVLDERGIKR